MFLKLICSVSVLVFELSLSHLPSAPDYIWRPDKVYVAQFHCAPWFFNLWVYIEHMRKHFMNEGNTERNKETLSDFHLSLVDGVHDPGARVHAVVSLLPHHPLLPIRAQRGPHWPASGPHHRHAAHRPRAALHLLGGVLHPAAESADSHDERHPLEGGPGAGRALEDSGIAPTRVKGGNIGARKHLTIVPRLQLWWCCPGGSHDTDAGEEAASLPLASTRGVRAELRSEGALVSEVRQWFSTRN